MDDTIYRQAAIDEIVTWLKDRMTDRKNGKPLTDRIKDLPPAQSEIVRCKECKWSYDDVFGRACSHGVCVDCVVSDDFYCADAERRTDEQIRRF